jgi:hypothetical protein
MATAQAPRGVGGRASSDGDGHRPNPSLGGGVGEGGSADSREEGMRDGWRGVVVWRAVEDELDAGRGGEGRRFARVEEEEAAVTFCRFPARK